MEDLFVDHYGFDWKQMASNRRQWEASRREFVVETCRRWGMEVAGARLAGSEATELE